MTQREVVGGGGHKKSWRQETGPQITPTLFFVLMRVTLTTETVKKDNDRQPEVKIGEDEKEREGGVGKREDILLQQTLPTRHETGAGETSTGSPLVFSRRLQEERVRVKQHSK